MSSESPDNVLDNYLSLAIGVICAWLIPHVAIEIAEYRYEIIRSKNWKGLERQMLGMDTITNAAIFAVLTAGLLLAGSAAGVALTTQGMDWRAKRVITGLSHISAAVVIFFISYKTPKWIGVYWSNKHDCGKPVGHTVKHLRFNIQWSIWRHFGQIYFLSLLFFCGAPPIKIPLSAFLGILAGFMIWYFVYLGRTKLKKQKKEVAIFMAFLISIASAIAFSTGCGCIQQVWGRNPSNEALLSISSFLVWLAAEGLVHVVIYTNTMRKDRKAASMPPDQRAPRKYKTMHFHPKHMSSLKKQMIELAELEDSRKLGEDEKRMDSNCNEGGDTNGSKENGGKDANGSKDGGDSDIKVPKVINAASDHVNAGSERTSFDQREAEDKYIDSWFSLVRLHCCENAERAGERPCKSALVKFISILKWTAWCLANLLSLFLVIVNIGATHQKKAVQKNLPAAYALQYPPDYNNGTVCAWDNNGPGSIIQTFETPDEALAAKFSIVHCGACGACSTWQDLRLQWTTRKYLADVAQDCAKKSFLGGRQAVKECNENKIGFSEECATCWTIDQLCAKKNCVFIFFQVIMINKLTNFQVGPDEITTATCDEAMCGPEFVPCSGATRRRMDVISTITRPFNQQCRIINQDWATIFDHP